MIYEQKFEHTEVEYLINLSGELVRKYPPIDENVLGPVFNDKRTHGITNRNPMRNTMLHKRYVMVHFTSGNNTKRSVSWLTRAYTEEEYKTGRLSSAHIVISPEGNVHLLAPLIVETWHAGSKKWNGCSVGIEFVNAGPVEFTADNKGHKAKHAPDYVDTSYTEIAMHQKEKRMGRWHKFTNAQLCVGFSVIKAIHDHYNLSDIIGHDEVSNNRLDPGPLFPMTALKHYVFNRS